MRVPVSWLREYVPIEIPLEELATRLSVASAEIEGIASPAPAWVLMPSHG